MPELYKDKYKITSNRLQGYDYGSEGAYFITICTGKHLTEFGAITQGKMHLNDYGRVVKTEWYLSQKIRKEISFGEFCIMPNHIHGIVLFGNPLLSVSDNVKINLTDDYKNKFGSQKRSLSTFINQLKGACTRKIIKKGNKSFTWQSNFYDRIIRNQKELLTIENYIRTNSQNWDKDQFYRPM